jgi:hypothetical protein
MNTTSSLENIMISSEPQDPVTNHGYFCVFCAKRFHFRDLFDQHNATCEFFYKSRRDKQRETESFETLPSPQEQYKLIQHLMLEVSKQKKEIVKLKSATVGKKRKVILEWLQSGACSVPIQSFEEWSKSIPVSGEDLEKVFQGDLTDGFKSCIERHILEQRKTHTALPLYAFKQKPGTIYVWSQPTKPDELDGHVRGPVWMMMQSDPFDRWINRLSHRFLQVFIEWQMANSVRIHSCDEEKDKNVEYMRKINGLGRAYEDRRRNELRKWLFCLLENDFKEMVEWDFV